MANRRCASQADESVFRIHDPSSSGGVDLRRATVVHDSRYGNTAKVAEAIADVLRGSGFDEVRSETVESADVNEVATCCAIFVGSPNHIGGPTRRVRRFIRNLAAFDLSDRRVCFFDTYIGGDFGRAVGKMHNEFKARNDTADTLSPGLSLRVKGMKGPLAEGELAKVEDFVRATVSSEGET